MCDTVRDQVLDITPTFITLNVLSMLWQVDHVSNQESKGELRDIDCGV